MISSEAKRALVCRGPWDVINLAAIWGLGQEKGREAVGREARAVVVQAEMKRSSFRGVIDVVYGGEKPQETSEASKSQPEKNNKLGKGKRKAEALESNIQAALVRKTDDVTPSATPLSKREQKRRAKKAKFENAKSKDKTEVPIAARPLQPDMAVLSPGKKG